MITRSKGLGGFTLIELLLALSIFSLVVVSLYGVFWSGVRLSERADQNADQERQALWVFEWVAQDLANCQAFEFGGQEIDQKAFIGEATMMRFLMGSTQGLRWVRYQLTPADQGEIHRVIVRDKQQKNRLVTEQQGTSINESWDFIRESWGFAQGVNDRNGNTYAREVLASGLAAQGLQFVYGTQTDTQEISFWKDNQCPSSLQMELTFQGFKRVHTTGDSNVIYRQEIVIPSGIEKQEAFVL